MATPFRPLRRVLSRGAPTTRLGSGYALFHEASPTTACRPLNLPEIVLIAAVAEENRVIGRGQELPWHIPEDLRHFKALTRGHPLVMGRRTFESITAQFGGPLPERRHLVLTSQGRLPEHPQIETFTSIKAALRAAENAKCVFIGGGARVYEQFLPMADRLELTLIEGRYEGDTYFPAFEHLLGTAFEETACEAHDGFRFVRYERKRR